MTGFATSTLVAAAAMALATPAAAQQVLEFTNASGWVRGSYAREQCAEGVCVSLDIRPQFGEPNAVYAVANYRTPNGMNWCGGSRVTRNYPSSSHFTQRVRGTGTSTWGEQMPSGIQTIYVYVRNDRC